MPSETSFIPRLLERADVIIRMKAQHLSLDWRHKFSLEELSACCERMEKSLPGTVISDEDAQRELIENPAFAAYLAKLLALLPEEPPAPPEQPPAYSYGARRYVPPDQEAQAAPQSSGMDYAGVISAFSGRLDGISNQLTQLLQRLDPAAPADDGKESGQHERRT